VSIDLVKSIFAEDVDPSDELDFSDDEYCYNDLADFAFATVQRRTEWYDGATGEPWITLHTDQGSYEMPADHLVKKKIIE